MDDLTSLTAGDVMTTGVVTVEPTTPLRIAARRMVDRGVSGLPVVDDAGRTVGVVTEADLIRPNDAAERRRDWWLNLLADGYDLSPEFEAAIRATDRPVSQVMHREVFSVTEATPLHEVAEVLTAKGVKRVVVLRDGKIVGVVSRADLVRAMSGHP
jgi:CBS domain-containing protein